MLGLFWNLPSPCSQGAVVHSHLAQVEHLQDLPRPGLTGRSGRKGLGTRYPSSLDGKAQEQVALGYCGLEDVQGARSMHPHFSSEQRPLLCKDSGGFGGATCCPDYTGQSLMDRTHCPATSASSGAWEGHTHSPNPAHFHPFLTKHPREWWLQSCSCALETSHYLCVAQNTCMQTISRSMSSKPRPSCGGMTLSLSRH